MFNIDGESLNLDIMMELDDVTELKGFILPRLEYIEEIHFEGTNSEFATSAVFQLLFALKKTKPSLKIPMIDSGSCMFDNFGKIEWKSV